MKKRFLVVFVVLAILTVVALSLSLSPFERGNEHAPVQKAAAEKPVDYGQLVRMGGTWRLVKNEKGGIDIGQLPGTELPLVHVESESGTQWLATFSSKIWRFDVLEYSPVTEVERNKNRELIVYRWETYLPDESLLEITGWK